VNKNSFAKVENGDLYSEGHLLMWRPKNQNEKLTFTIDQPGGGDYIIGFTMAHLPGGGSFSTYLNGELIQLGERESIDLQEPQRIFLRNYFSKSLTFKYGINEISFQPTGKGYDKMIGFDFLWLKKK